MPGNKRSTSRPVDSGCREVRVIDSWLETLIALVIVAASAAVVCLMVSINNDLKRIKRHYRDWR